MTQLSSSKVLNNSDENNQYLEYNLRSEMSIFDKKIYMGPIHCICFSRSNSSILYAGIGPNLHIFNAYSGRELYRVKLFEKGGSIKGIKFLENEKQENSGNNLCENLIVFGQKRLKIVQMKIVENNAQEEISCSVANYGEMCDWILDVIDTDLSLDGSSRCLAIGYAHNFVEIVSFDKKSIKPFGELNQLKTCEENFSLTILKSFRSYPNCLLYSMSLFMSQSESPITTVDDIIDRVDVASGTVFNQVIVWNARFNTKDTVITLKGHDGVLFHVEWAKDGKMLCSTSDDRTLILWKFEEKPFTNTELVGEKFTYKSITFFGHTARVWHCKFTQNFIVSASEDATIRIWDYEGNCVSTLQGHIGRNVWRVDIDRDEQVIASGGGDSSVKLWSLKRIKDFAVVHESLTLPNMDTTILKKQADMVRCMHANNHLVYVGTKRGLVFEINMLSGQHREIFNIGSTLSANTLLTVIKCSPCGNYLTIGSSEGSCLVIDLKTNELIIKFSPFNTRILSIFWVTNLDSTFSLYFTSPMGIVKCIKLVPTENALTTEEGAQYSMKGKVLTMCSVRDEKIILTGDDNGFVHILRVNDNTQEYSPEFLVKSHTDQVCDIKFINRNNIYSVGRDGTICFYDMVEDETTGLLSLVKHGQEKMKSIIPIMDKVYVIEKIENTGEYKLLVGCADFVDTVPASLFNKKETEIILLGFYGSHFIVYNYSKRFRVASCQCGASRGIYNLDYSDIYGANQLCFSASFFRDSQIQHFREKQESSLTLFKNQTPFTQFHGREVLNATHWKSTDGNLRILTSSEDTKIRLLSYPKDDSSISLSLNTMSILNGHESSVKELVLANISGNNNSNILVSGGGKEQLIIWKLEEHLDSEGYSTITSDTLFNIGLTKQYLPLFHPQIYNDHILRKEATESNIDSSKGYLLKNKTRMDVINFRILALETFSPDNKELIVLTGSSDGLIKIFKTENQLTQIKPLGCSSPHTGPVMSLSSIVIGTTRLLFSGSTNGKIYCFRIPEFSSTELTVIQPFFECEVHQSGVNCISISLGEDSNTIHVATGGDDQSVNLVVLKYENDSLEILRNIHIESVHSSAVSGIYTNGKNSIISISIDQRLNMYKISPQEDAFEIVASCMSEVCDIANMHVVEEENFYRIIVVGIGMQIINLRKLVE